MGLESATFGKIERKISIIIFLLVLLMGSFLSFAPTAVQAASVSAPINVDKSKKTSSIADQMLQASTQANTQRSTDVSSLTSPFNSDIKPASDLVTALTTPLSVLVNSDGVTYGPLSDNGLGRLKANVSYLMMAYINTDNVNANDTKNQLQVASTTQITAVDNNGNPTAGFSRAEFKDGNGDALVLDDNGQQIKPVSINNKSGSATLSNLTRDSVTLKYNNRSNTYGSNVNNQPLDPGPAAAAQVRVYFGLGQWGTISIPAAQVSASIQTDQIFNNTSVDFEVSPALLKATIQDTINNLKKKYANSDNYKDLSIDNNIKINWKIWASTQKNGVSVGYQDFDNGIQNLYDTNKDPDNDAEYSEGLNKSASQFTHQFYRADNNHNPIGNETQGSPVYVFADISLGYTYKTPGLTIWSDWKTKNGKSQVRLDGWTVSPANTPTNTDDLPEVTGTSGINDTSEPTKDQEVDTQSGLAKGVLDPKANDNITYTSKIHVDVNHTGSSSGTIDDGVYKTEIPSDMTIDENSINIEAMNYSFYPEKLHVSETADPNDATKKILKISGIELTADATQSGGTIDYTMTFNGTAGSNTKSIDFTPTFDGTGGQTIDDQGTVKPLPIKQVSMTPNYIHYSNQPEGKLEMTPHDIYFGAINSYIGQSSIKHRVTPTAGSNILDVSDNRSSKPATTLTISADNLTLDGLANGSVFPGALTYFDKSGNQTVLTKDNSIPIAHTSDGESIPSINWSENEGLLLKLNRASAIPKGTYKSTVTWTATNSL